MNASCVARTVIGLVREADYLGCIHAITMSEFARRGQMQKAKHEKSPSPGVLR
jgi:hypothetical protein